MKGNIKCAKKSHPAKFPASAIIWKISQKDNKNTYFTKYYKCEGSFEGSHMLNFTIWTSTMFSCLTHSWHSVFYKLTWHLNSNWSPTKIVKFHWILLIKPPSQQTQWCRNLPFISFLCWELHIHPHGEFHNLFIPPKLWILSRLVGEMFSFAGNVSAIPPNAGNTLVRHTLHASHLISFAKW